MSEPGTAKGSLYLYAVVPAADDLRLGAIGLAASEVYSIAQGPVSVVVSEVPAKIRPERRQLAAHQEVLNRLMAEQPAVLPVAFGVLADNREAVHGIIARNQKTFSEQFTRVGGRVEMGLRVTWDVPSIFEYFVVTHPELRIARDRFLGGPREPTQEDKIEVGRLFERLLTEEREEHTDRVVEVLQPHCVEIKRNRPRSEREAIHLACLIAREAQEEFGNAVVEAAQLFDNSYTFDYNGPWAPHNFVDLSLEV